MEEDRELSKVFARLEDLTMNRRWLLAVPFLSAIFWGSCRDPMASHASVVTMTELDVCYAVCAWAGGMIALIIVGVLVQESRKSA